MGLKGDFNPNDHAEGGIPTFTCGLYTPESDRPLHDMAPAEGTLLDDVEVLASLDVLDDEVDEEKLFSDGNESEVGEFDPNSYEPLI